jgi:exopolysaccharide biosynthesis protein
MMLHRSTNAVLSINADFYQNRDFGVVVYNSTLYRFPTSTYTGSYKKYNCLETCYVNDEGDFLFTELGQVFTQEELERYIEDNHILFSISFGPVLVRDGEVRECDWYPVGEINKGYSRAGIGQVDKLHYLYMSLNHSAEASARWTVNQFARHFGEKPVQNAYCLDGGQTSEIVFQGRPYNHVDYGEERPVSDNIYFATAIGGTEVSR